MRLKPPCLAGGFTAQAVTLNDTQFPTKLLLRCLVMQRSEKLMIGGKMKKHNVNQVERNRIGLNSFVRRFISILMLTSFCIFSIGCPAPIVNKHPVSAKMTGISFRPLNVSEDSPNALTYWVRKNDEVSIQWDTYRILWSKDDIGEGDINSCTFGEMPDASVENIPSNCEMLDLCRSEFEVENLGLSLVADYDFMRSENPTFVSRFFENERFLRACTTNTQGIPPTLIATKSGLYRLKDAAEPGSIEIFEGVPNGEAKIHVLDSEINKSQTIKYDLTKQRIGSIDYWRWQMPDDSVWSDNFSENVQVTKVRILENGNEVMPSRIVFLPAFQGQVSGHGQEQSNSCHINNNEINLKTCDNNPDVNTENINSRLTTPVYIQGQSPELLNWFVEFNTIQGGDDATNFSDLEIEFTIEAIN